MVVKEQAAVAKTNGPSTTVARVLYLDWLRILAVVLLVPFHSARIFDIFEEFYVKNAALSAWLSWVVVRFLDVWQMPILFFIAGASTCYALRYRGGGGYVRERLKRLLVPFAFGTLVLIPPQMYYALLHRGSTADSYLTYYPRFFTVRTGDQMTNDYTGVGFSYAHLWFILYLFVIAMIALPLFLWLRGPRGQRFVSRLAGFCQRRGAILLLALVFPLIGDAPELLGKPFITYLILFVLGFLLLSDSRFGQGLARSKEIALALGVVALAIMYPIALAGTQFVDNSLEDVLFYFLRTMNVWFWLVALLGYGQRYLNADNRLLRYARDGAYPFYVLHQSVIVAVGYYVVQWSLDLNLKYAVVVLASLVITVALYDLVVRRTNLTRWLFGMKPKSRPAPPAPEAG